MKRLRQWWARKRAERTLRAAGFCPACFSRLVTQWAGFEDGGWDTVCPICDIQATADDCEAKVIAAAMLLMEDRK